MRVVMFVHSIRSCWNNGNAHFLRGIASELIRRGHAVDVYEPSSSWSAQNLAYEHGTFALRRYRAAYPELSPIVYQPRQLDLARVTDGADVVLVHEWSTPELVAALGRARRSGRFRLFFHDTHHRALTDDVTMSRLDLRDYDGVLAFGESLRQLYLRRGWAQRVWTWHEAADPHVFRPLASPIPPSLDRATRGLVWIGNFGDGDGERSAELQEYLLDPAQENALAGEVYGVRYSPDARMALRGAGLTFRGWLPNHEVPSVFARHRLTVHVPRRPYAARLPGIPTIRVFEALACGIPLVCAPWDDVEGLFLPGRHYLLARDGRQMAAHMRNLTYDLNLCLELGRAGRAHVLERHTCGHRVDELLGIVNTLAKPQPVHARALGASAI